MYTYCKEEEEEEEKGLWSSHSMAYIYVNIGLAASSLNVFKRTGLYEWVYYKRGIYTQTLSYENTKSVTR